MRRFFIFDKFNTWHDWRCTLTAKDIPEAEPKYDYIELDGVHGTFDATEALTGEVSYSDRTLSASFMCSEGTYQEREALLRRIVASLHGRKVQIIEPDDPDHYFLGRVKVTNVAKFQSYMTFTLETQCDPWRYAIEETHRMVDLSSGVAATAEPMMAQSTRAADVVASGNCGSIIFGDEVKWALDSAGVLTISGVGKMADYTRDVHAPWYDYREAITSVVVEPGVTYIGEYAFHLLTASTRVSIPDSVTSIGNCAFLAWWSLTSVNIPDSVTSIDTAAFQHCTKLVSVKLPTGLVTIPQAIFYGCHLLASITIPASVRAIGMNAFYDCEQLSEVHFLGDAPSVAHPDSLNASFPDNAVLFYTPGTAGWTDSDSYDAATETWNGYQLIAMCSHSATIVNNKPNGDGTHTSTTVCLYCGEELFSTVEDCADTDNDQLCDKCGSSFTLHIPTEVDVVLFNSGVKTLCPELYVEGTVVVTFDGASVELEPGVYKIPDLKLRQGDNLVHVTGDGSIEFVYREATL